MDHTSTTTKEIGEKTLTSRSIAKKIKQGIIEHAIAYIWIAVSIAILLIVFDIVKDYSLHQRITELEREIAAFRINQVEEDQGKYIEFLNEKNRINIVLECLRKNRYWDFEKCFK